MTHLRSRRENLSLSDTVVACLLAAPEWLAGAAGPSDGGTTPMSKANPKFQPVYDKLADQMRRFYDICRVEIDGHEFIDVTGKPGGAADFFGSPSMPLMGTRAILSGPSLLDDM